MTARRLALGLLFPLLVLVLWEVLAQAGLLPEDGFPPISQILPALAGGLLDGSVWLRTYETLAGAVLGWAIAAGAGVPAGLILGLSRPLERITSSAIEALRPIPSAALIPISLLIFGFSVQMSAAVTTFACFWPILIVTIGAVRGIDPRLIELGRALGFGTLKRVWRMALPAALPGIAVGLRVAFGIAIVVTVTVEIAANPRGLGYAMITAQQSLHSEEMYGYLFWLGLVGWALNAASVRGEKHWLRWYWAARGAS